MADRDPALLQVLEREGEQGLHPASVLRRDAIEGQDHPEESLAGSQRIELEPVAGPAREAVDR